MKNENSIVERYRSVIDSVNSVAARFNELLAPEARFQLVDPSVEETFSSVAGVEWGDQRWPSSPSAGVYVTCGYREDLDRFAAYVGKSSRAIGGRLWTHLHPQRSSGSFAVTNYDNESFPLEAILALPVAKGAPNGLASALEEFILEAGIEGVELVNAIGNRPA